MICINSIAYLPNLKKLNFIFSNNFYQMSHSLIEQQPIEIKDEKKRTVIRVTHLCTNGCAMNSYQDLDPSYAGNDSKLLYCDCKRDNALRLRAMYKRLGKKNNPSWKYDGGYSIKTLRSEIKLRRLFDKLFVPSGCESSGHAYYIRTLEAKEDELKKIYKYPVRKIKPPIVSVIPDYWLDSLYDNEEWW